MEIWSLKLPPIGAIRVEHGYDHEFQRKYSNWPFREKKSDKTTRVGQGDTFSDGVDRLLNPSVKNFTVVDRFRRGMKRADSKLNIYVVGNRNHLVNRVTSGTFALTDEFLNSTDSTEFKSTVSGSRMRYIRNKEREAEPLLLEIKKNLFNEIVYVAAIDPVNGRRVFFTPQPHSASSKYILNIFHHRFRRLLRPLAMSFLTLLAVISPFIAMTYADEGFGDPHTQATSASAFKFELPIPPFLEDLATQFAPKKSHSSESGSHNEGRASNDTDAGSTSNDGNAASTSNQDNEDDEDVWDTIGLIIGLGAIASIVIIPMVKQYNRDRKFRRDFLASQDFKIRRGIS
ncbi:hypothetical protein [Arcanobacterium bovis]|uniref:Uncharacterized protein n=1 Tax=Arcanobacterium bovis TaxID=2529275 RepID=A0A4Q9V223_9ACTO|nr:hypothetical protein [Arcanobacterium bovis]TBW23685.1 hypothetical protein EZJ44_00645 [Arcanobacterium bovis]